MLLITSFWVTTNGWIAFKNILYLNYIYILRDYKKIKSGLLFTFVIKCEHVSFTWLCLAKSMWVKYHRGTCLLAIISEQFFHVALQSVHIQVQVWTVRVYALLVSDSAVRHYDSYTDVAGAGLGTPAGVFGSDSLSGRGHGMLTERGSREPSAIKGWGHHFGGNLFFSQQLDWKSRFLFTQTAATTVHQVNYSSKRLWYPPVMRNIKIELYIYMCVLLCFFSAFMRWYLVEHFVFNVANN